MYEHKYNLLSLYVLTCTHVFRDDHLLSNEWSVGAFFPGKDYFSHSGHPFGAPGIFISNSLAHLSSSPVLTHLAFELLLPTLGVKFVVGRRAVGTKARV